MVEEKPHFYMTKPLDPQNITSVDPELPEEEADYSLPNDGKIPMQPPFGIRSLGIATKSEKKSKSQEMGLEIL